MEARRVPLFLAVLCTLILASAFTATAQNITDYSLTATSGTFVPLDTTLSVEPTRSGGSADDGWYNDIPIGFTFDYNGSTYTELVASTNGWVGLGQDSIASGGTGTANNLTSGGTTSGPGSTSARPIIAPFWDDLEVGSTGYLAYFTEGSPGTREFTLEWRNMYWNYTATSASISFQMKLHEANGEIEFIYQQESGTTAGLIGASIGLTAATTGSGNFLSLDGTGANPNVSSTSETTTLSTRPASGQTYAFTRSPMTYTSSTVTQDSSAVTQGALDARIIGIEVVTSGALSPLSATQFNVNTTGTTNTADIVNAKLYYTGTSSIFSPVNQFGSTVASPSGAFTFTGSQTLYGGTNYFWMTYDVSVTATVNNVLDAQCTQITVAGTPRTPTVTAPLGSRQIRAALNGTYTIDPGGGGGTNYTTFTAAVSDLNLLGISGPVTFNVKAGAVFTGAISITATGIASRPIIFQRSGVGANPVIQDSGTASTTESIVKLTGSDYITFDGIDLQPTPGYTSMEWGYYFLGTAADGCQNNTVKNCVMTMARTNTSARGVFLSSVATAASGANSGNKFYNNTIKYSHVGYWLGGASAAPDDGNEIGTSGGGTSLIQGLGGGTTASYGIYYGYQTTFKVFSTTVDSITTTSGTIGGIYNSGGAANTVEIYNNTIKNLITSSGTVYGIYGGFSGTTYDVHGNEISGLTSSASTLYGIYHGAGTVNVYKNKIHDLFYSGSSTSVIYGLYTGGGTTQNIYNNFFYDLRSPNGTSTSSSVNGIYISSGTTINLYHNSVLLNYLSGAAANQSNALYVSSTPTSLDLRNNIFVNMVDLTTGTRAVAFRKSSTSLTNISLLTNNNLYYAGTPGPKNLIFYDGTNSDTSLAAYKVRMVDRDQSAVTENPPFLSVSAPYNLHLNATIATQCESGGTPVTTPIAVTDDIDGNARNASTPDIGGDEFNGIGLDVNPPSINYTPLPNTAQTTARTLITSITDASGVPTAGGGLPVLYWKRNSGSWSPATAVYVSGSQYNFTFGGGVIAGDTVSYYLVARDLAGTPHIGSSPGGASGFTYDPPAASTPPPTLNSYMILTLISSFPYNEDFEDSPLAESNGAGWITGIVSGTVNDWERATPRKTFITHAHSGAKAYVTVDSGSYSNSHNAFIQAPILDFSGMTADPVVDFYQNFFTEVSWDAGILEYSYDGGLTWRRQDSTLGSGPNFNTLNSTGWYNNSGTTGPTPPPKWSDTSATKYASADSGWIRSTTVLTGAAGLSDVRLRWRFVTDGSVTRNGGWAIDDVSIYQGTGGVNIGVSVAAGWNMISNPVTTAADSVKQLFPPSLFPYCFAFAGAGGYQQRYRMENGVGYWGKFPAVATVTVSGTSRTLDTIEVAAGWNMVGSISSAVDTSTIVSIPPGLRVSSGWIGFPYSTGEPIIVPGKGYWVKTRSAGSFVFAAGTAPDKVGTARASVEETMNSVTVRDAQGGSQTLYFGMREQATEYDMPPVPPEGVFDARFETEQGGAMLRTHAGGAILPIGIRSAAMPLTVSWNVRSGEYLLDAGRGLEPMRGEGTLTISGPVSRLTIRSQGGEIPADYALLQNYPNPFNPSTTIKFGLPEASRVRVEVYNLLGQRVSTLVDNLAMEAGYQTVEWKGTGGDGHQLGSGVYFVRFTADGSSGKAFTDIRKMMLIK